MRGASSEFRQRLLAAKRFDEALRLFFHEEGGLSYAQVSRKMGFRSRSHVREIVEGLKPAPKTFAQSFGRALKLSSPWILYLEALQRKAPTADLAGLRAKLAKANARRELAGAVDSARPFLRDPLLPAVFAALGEASVGATVEEIAVRTRVAATRIRSLLAELLPTGAIEEKEGRFVAKDAHLLFSGLGTEEFFRRDLKHTLEKARSELRESADPHRTLFFNSTYCVRSADLPRLREDLKELLCRYVDGAESAGGDRIVSLLTCLF